MVLSVCIHHFKQLLLIILGAVRRALCCFKRRRVSDGDIVPLATVGVIPDRNASSTQGSGENWDNWGRGNTVREQIEDYRFRQQVKQAPPPEPPPEFYFQDMEPQIKTQAKVIVKTNSKENNMESPSRLSLVADLPVTGAELETWEEHRAGWEEAENWGLSAADKLKDSRRPLGVKLS